jgi:hypothetical protein
MQLETITVQYVNPPKPGKKMGSIKDTTGRYINVWPDKLAQFQPNGTYNVLIEEGSWQGKQTYTLKSMADEAPAPKANGSAPIQEAKPLKPVPLAPRETSGKDAERMFVCSLMNAGIQAGQINLGEDDLTSTVTSLRFVWQQTFGKAEF